MQVVPEQLTAGKMVRCPMLFPWVLETAPRRDTFKLAVDPFVSVKVYCPPYAQSLLVMVKVGRASPERRYGGVKTSTRYSSGKDPAGSV